MMNHRTTAMMPDCEQIVSEKLGVGTRNGTTTEEIVRARFKAARLEKLVARQVEREFEKEADLYTAPAFTAETLEKLITLLSDCSAHIKKLAGNSTALNNEFDRLESCLLKDIQSNQSDAPASGESEATSRVSTLISIAQRQKKEILLLEKIRLSSASSLEAAEAEIDVLTREIAKKDKKFQEARARISELEFEVMQFENNISKSNLKTTTRLDANKTQSTDRDENAKISHNSKIEKRILELQTSLEKMENRRQSIQKARPSNSDVIGFDLSENRRKSA